MASGFGTALKSTDGVRAGRNTGTVTVSAVMVISAVIAAVMKMASGFGTAFKGADRVCAGNRGCVGVSRITGVSAIGSA